MHYVMTMRDDGYWLVGPFDGHAAAEAWGKNPANNPENDPRWQVMRLVDPTAPVAIVAPTLAATTRGFTVGR